jgi:xylulokinase
MASQFILGIDVGTSGCKALLIDDHGKVVRRYVREHPLSIPRPGWSEQNPEDWWKATKIVVKYLLKEFHSVADIKGIGLSGQMHGLVTLDKESQVVRPAILWNDQRTEKQCDEIHRRAGGGEGPLQLTNNRMLPGYTGGKILWVRENEPHHYEKIRRVLNPKDYIRFRLTGEFATEVSDASGTGLFNVWNRDWSYQLLELLDISKEWLPRCYESSDISGTVARGLQDNSGFQLGSLLQEEGTPLYRPQGRA